MNNQTDSQLLRAYAEHRSEPAFAELVRRHVDFVYSAALRMVCDSHLAEDVTQGVFVSLAKNAAQLTDRPVLSGWLHRTAQNIAAQTVRTDVRRRAREQEAAVMNELLSAESDAVWENIAPHLDAALGELSEPDRDALLLRYFERKSARAMAQTLGISDEAAQKRVNRAVERLRESFAKRGATVGAGGLVAVISTNAVQAAPAGLAITISTAAALAALSIPASAGVAATTGFFGTLLQVPQIKFLAGLAAAVLVGVGIFISIRSLHRADADAAPGALQTTAANPELNQQAAGLATQEANAADDQREPDPLKLLQAVAQARQRIVSGSMEFQFSFEHFNYFGSGRRVTNDFRMVALFEGPKRRYEQFDLEYSYTYSADEAVAADITKRADSMSREEAVRAGLMKPFESHHVTVYDGSALLDYWVTDGKPAHVTIDDPGKGSAQSVFDPRCLGLGTVMSPGSTVENCLAYSEARSIALVGEETVEGVPAWHVQVESKYQARLDFWIEIARPTRVLKQAYGSDFTLSKYDDANSRDPLPTEVTTMMFRNGSPAFRTRLIRSNSRFNVAVDPASFTLAGLGIAVGTSVSDNRIHRSIGYWTGAGLSENLPPKKGAESQSPPNLEELLALLEFYPTAPDALEAATWILLNTPDGPEVEKAANVIRQEHVGDTNLVYLCTQLERVRHRCSKELLETILKNNPSKEIQANACFTLATLLKDEAKFGQNKSATAQAEKLFQRVITEFSQAGRSGPEWARRAKPELHVLRHLIIGKPAPDSEGEDLNGRPMKLSDYRGKVIVLIFWRGDFSESQAYRKLIEATTGKPFALLGVNCDKDIARAQASVEKYRITWPSFRDGRDGPIASLWHVDGWPDIWVLDRHGIIRYRNVRWRELDNAVDTLLRE